ncbi:MAG: DEAD/DEAH box helicase [Bacteroidetes bacterium]|nr:MAG: DEAD/DEAH box helicase [Bacteroidota bacterium]
MAQYKPIAESNGFIVLDANAQVGALSEPAAGYQTEEGLEMEFIADLRNQGYEYCAELKTPDALLDNARVQLGRLNGVTFTDGEWARFLDEFLDCKGDGLVAKAQKIHRNYIHDFEFDDGRRQNIYLVDHQEVLHNRVQVINQFSQAGRHANRYDVTILVNGLPLVQVELKRRGVDIREAFNQVHRYSKESFNGEHSLFKYIQLFVISNGTYSRYFANTTKRNRDSYDFTMTWAHADNKPIHDLKDFTASFFHKNTLLQVLLKYSVLDTSDTLLVMRPYQIAATERILWKIRSAHEAKQWSTPAGGGYIWHTTGSGKTLTSFKAALLATRIDFIEKVFFVVDRKDLDYQTMKEYQRFSPDSVNGSADTAGLKRNIAKKDNKIIVTTIQKLNKLMKSESNLPIFDREVVFIFDEAHRSQFGEAQRNLRRKFKKYYQFGFTGTPIFAENAIGTETTADVFGKELHAYVITHAIRDEKVLKFKVDYNDVRPHFRAIEGEQDEEKLSAAENKKLLLHPGRIREVSQYILSNFRRKTHRTQGGRGFNAMFAVSSIEAAKLYYQELKSLQAGSEHPLKIATIFSYAANEEQHAIGDIADEQFEVSAMDLSAKEFLERAVADYNAMFGTSYGGDGQWFQNYYRDVAMRVKDREVDLLIVVGMFLTGFDAPTLNTLFVDKNLRYHGLMQAFSRTNRIYDKSKTFGNIVTFRNLEEATKAAIARFGEQGTRDVLLEKSYREYLEGFRDIISGLECRGYIEVVKDLRECFPEPTEIKTTAEKKEFIRVFGEYLRIENILQNFDEYHHLKELQKIDPTDGDALAAFKERFFLEDKDIAAMRGIDVLPERLVQDYRSTYSDIREWYKNMQEGEEVEEALVDWDDVVFEVELLKSQEIDLDYILALLLEYHRERWSREALVEEVRRLVRSSVDTRAKEELVVDFIDQVDFGTIDDRAGVIEAFFLYAQERMQAEVEVLIAEENLVSERAKRYIRLSLKRGFASENGTDLKELMPRMSPLDPKFLPMKRRVYGRIVAMIEKYKGVGGEL